MRTLFAAACAAAAVSVAACAQPGAGAQTAPAAPSVTIGERLLVARQPEMAADVFEKLIASDGPDPVSLTGLGVAYHQSGRRKLAERFFRAAIDLDPNLAIARNNLGVSLYDAGDYAAALSEFERAFAITEGLDRTVATNIGIAEIAVVVHADEVEVDDAEFDVIQYGHGVFRLQERAPEEKAAPKTAPRETEAQS